MTDDLTSRVLQLFEHRIQTDPEISPATVRTLLEGQRANDFGDDEELLAELVDTARDEQ